MEKEAVEKIIEDLRKDEVFYLPKRNYGRIPYAMLKSNEDGKLLAYGIKAVDLLRELQFLQRKEKATFIKYAKDETYTGWGKEKAEYLKNL